MKDTNKKMSKCQRKALIPVVKLSEPMTHRPWEFIDAPVIAVKMQDLIVPSGLHFNKLYYEIVDTGDIHNYLGYSGDILLSMIMDDKRIFGCTVYMYIEAVRRLNPDFFTTIDGENYVNDVDLSEKELQRMLIESSNLIKQCPESVPVGLIKGASYYQVIDYTKKLNEIGLTDFIFHSGDFLCKKGKDSVTTAVKYVRLAKSIAPRVFVYGIGSPKHILRLFSADGFITQSHYVNAFYGQRLMNGRWMKCKNSKDYIMENLKQIKNCITIAERQQGGLLNGWVV